MESKWTTHFIIFSLLLAVSLGANIYSISQLHRISTEMVNWGEVGDAQRQLKTEVQSVRGAVESLRSQIAAGEAEERRFTPGELILGERRGSTQPVTFLWQVKEYEKGAEVSLHYRLSSAAEYEEVEAEAAGEGSFKAQVEFDLTMEPGVKVEFDADGFGEKMPKKIEGIDRNTPNQYQYYFTLDNGDKVYTSQTRTLDLSKVVANALAPLAMVVKGSKDDTFEVVIREQSPAPSVMSLQEVTVEGVGDGQSLGKATLTKDTEEDVHRGTLSLAGGQLQVLRLLLTYDEGTQISKEIRLR